MSSYTSPNDLRNCFQNWMTQQHKDLDELLTTTSNEAGTKDEDMFRSLIQTNIKHFEEYQEKRSLLVRDDPLLSFSSMWCSSFENSFLWIAGTRPSSTIQLVYTLCGSELEAHLSDFLQGVRKGNLGELSARQLNWVNDLHCKIVREEDKISRRLENLQEEVGEEPLELEQIGESNGHVYQGLNEYMLALASIMEDADELRLKSLKELMSILSPLQGVNFMVASKKLYLSMHEWGKY